MTGFHRKTFLKRREAIEAKRIEAIEVREREMVKKKAKELKFDAPNSKDWIVDQL